MNLRQIILILFLSQAVFISAAEETNYYCVVCGKGPLTGNVWRSKWGMICEDCYKLEDRCSICGLPIREGGGAVKTGDGRLICKFDKPNAVLDAEAAKAVFEGVRSDLTSLFGPGFALKYPEVTVNVFDVDYWSEKGREDGLHKYGFASTRKTKDGACTHEVVMLSGRLRTEIAATAAHEYTHLWINENLPASHVIAPDTVEAICELTAYELMGSRAQPEQQKRILENPYTHGEINKLVEVETEHGGFRYILDWVRESTATNFEVTAAARVVPPRIPAMTVTNVPSPLPDSLRLAGLLATGNSRSAIINGISFAAGEMKPVPLRGRTVTVRCREINRDGVVLEVDGQTTPMRLKMGEEQIVP